MILLFTSVIFLGKMIVTNLRIIWHSMAMPRVNLCKHSITSSLFTIKYLPKIQSLKVTDLMVLCLVLVDFREGV